MTRTKIVLLVLLSSLVISYNACSGGFHAEEAFLNAPHVNLSSSNPSTGDDPALIQKGEQLYSQNCTACHGEIKKSLVPTFEAEAIYLGFSNIPSMAIFKGKLSFDDAKAISAALKSNLSDANGFQSGKSLNFTCQNPAAAGANNDRFYRLTSVEFKNVIGDLIPGILNDSQVQSALLSMGDDNLATNVEGFTETQHPGFFAGQFKIAKRAAEILAGNSNLRGTVLGSCATSSTISSACIDNILANFGLEVYRRPLTSNEVQIYKSLFTKYGSTNSVEGLKVVVTRLLVSPSLAFKVEIGTPGNDQRSRLTDYEVASRISFKTTGSLPDSELFAAAKRGDLQNIGHVRSHIQRLLKTDKARARKKEMIAYYTGLDKVSNGNDAVAKKAGITLQGLREEMQQELLDFADHVMSVQNGSFYDLMTSDNVFPLSTRMAKILETSVTTPGKPVKTTRLHRGLILRPALLASSGQRTDILHRGIHFRRQFLCSLGSGLPPDPETIANAVNSVDLDSLPNRVGISQATGSPQCVTCHAVFNPLAYVLEAHDQLGMVRQNELIFDNNGYVIKSFPIDTTVTRSYVDRQNDTPLNDAGDLAEKFGTSAEANACFVARAFTYYNLRGYNSDKDGCALKAGADAAISRASIDSVIENIIGSESVFWRSK